MDDFEIKLKALLINTFGFNQEIIKHGSHFYNDLGLDSLDMVELTVEIEKEFNIVISDIDFEELKTIGDAENYLREKLI